MKDIGKRFVRIALRLVFSGGLLFFLCRAIDTQALVQYFLQIKILWICAAFCLLLFLRFAVSVKWQIILKHHAINIPFLELLRVVIVSTTIGQLLPAGVGTDLIRGYSLSKKYGQRLGMAATIIIDRIVGMVSLFFLALIGSVCSYFLGVNTGLIVILSSINLFFLLIWYQSHLLKKIVDAIIPTWPRLNTIRQKLLNLVDIVSDKEKNRTILPWIFNLSVAVQLLRCLVFYILYLSFGHHINFIYFVVFIPLLFAITLIPVSIGGLGVREGVLVFFQLHRSPSRGECRGWNFIAGTADCCCCTGSSSLAF